MEGKKEEGGQADSTNAPIRRSHTSRELRMLDISEQPPSKRVKRPTRGAEAVDNLCEATRESNMICPITCGCQNSLLDIMDRSSVRFRLKPDNSNSHEFELHRPSNKGTKLLLKVTKAIIIRRRPG